METVIQRQNSWTVKMNSYLLPNLLLAIDYLVVCFGISTALFIRDILVNLLEPISNSLAVKDAYLYLVLPTLYVSFIAYADMYGRRMMFYQCAGILFKISTYVSITIIIVAYLLGMAEPISRLFMMLFWAISFIYLCTMRYFVKKMLYKFDIWQRPVIIVGAGKTAELLANTFEHDSNVGYRIIGFIEDDQRRPLLKRYPHLGTFSQVEEVIRRANIQDVILATPGLKRKDLVDLFYRIQPYVRNLTIVPDVFGVPIGNIKIETLLNEKALLVNTVNNLNRQSNQLLKRLFDLVVGGSVFICILPILVILTALIKLDSAGSAYHIAKRIGKNGKKFYCYKFRTMHENADEILEKFFQEKPNYREEWEKFAKLRTIDPRVTKLGRFLRKYSLDELPQILNVLQGTMSLVGPRPYLPREKEKIGHYLHVISLTVPGITGLWQVSGRNEIEFSGRLKLDSWYVRNWSLWQDIVILAKTVKVVLGKDGAY